MKPVPILLTRMVRLLDQAQRAFSESLRKVKLLFLLEFPTTYFPEQGFSQVLRMCNKYRNCLDMNKTEANAIRLKLTSLQPGF